jgi:A/G-specific adenine glycosylase
MDKHLWEVSRAVLPHRHVYDFNQALMDLGATVCAARNPQCRRCPLKSKCRSYPFAAASAASMPADPTPASSSCWRPCIERDGRFLVTRRLKGTHLSGYWEFPGGKCEAGESHEACLARELVEELAVRADVGAELLVTEHAYPSRTVRFISGDARSAASPSRCSARKCAGSRARNAVAGIPEADRDLIDF